tara:strand:+ start:191 stop:766 length:576 start_codon:yes stop_codon:yes gene_type:complete
MKNKGHTSIAVFLDVDGVINSLNHLYTGGKFQMSSKVRPHRAGKYTVWIPDYMGKLVRAIYRSTDLYWLTTWREKANKYISPLLGLPSDIPVISDGLNTRNVQWKAAVCKPVAERLQDQGKTIYWIEDFRGFTHYELLDVLIPIDTDVFGEGVLLPQHLPRELTRSISKSGYTGPNHVDLLTNTGTTPVGA